MKKSGSRTSPIAPVSANNPPAARKNEIATSRATRIAAQSITSPRDTKRASATVATKPMSAMTSAASKYAALS